MAIAEGEVEWYYGDLDYTVAKEGDKLEEISGRLRLISLVLFDKF